jgi:Ser/Thr protein kinase RdoA (MazF antagonist)
MNLQKDIPPMPLDTEAISVIGTSLKESLDILEATELPIAVGHSDLNPGNILVTENNQAWFLDWMSCHVGPSLLSLEYLCCLLRRLHRGRLDWERGVVNAYIAEWNDAELERRLRESLRRIRVMAPFAFAVGCLDGRQSGSDIHPSLARLLRSIARRLYAEALPFCSQ